MIKLKRAYERAAADDGYRILIDRLWPRGLKKTALRLDEWAKELAPSAELRKSFGHAPEKWADFQSKYRAELRAPESKKLLEDLAKRARKGTVTLIYSARDTEHNDAVVLKEILTKRLKKVGRSAA
jgi:uncharacterized protein YeaO (DUF488 family)